MISTTVFNVNILLNFIPEFLKFINDGKIISVSIIPLKDTIFILIKQP
jgi:hypothetical protein